MILLQIVLFCLSAGTSLALPKGAPSLACVYMAPGHVASNGRSLIPDQQDGSMYTVNATWDNEEQRKYIRVSITGARLQGFLIQARQSVDGVAVGDFTMLPNDTRYQDCTHEKNFNAKASVTHKEPTLKDNVTLLWMPPLGAKGNITFYATIAKTKEIFWLKLPSNTIDLMAKSNRGSSLTMSLLPNVVFLVVTLFFKKLWT